MTADGPNVLLVCTDQQRYDWLGFTPELPVETPAVRRLADRGRRFTDAVCPAPVCNPSRSCLASGMEYDRCGVPNNEVDYAIDRGTLYRRLRDETGYHVAGCGKFDLTASYDLGMDGRPDADWGFSDARFTPAKNETVSRVTTAEGAARGPYTAFLAAEDLLEVHVEDYDRRRGRDPLVDGKLVSTDPTALPDDAYYDTWITRQGQGLIDAAPTDRPWFVQVNLQNPHDPWDVTQRMYDRFRDPPVDFPPPVCAADHVPPAIHQEVRRNYGAMVEHLDACLGRLIESVSERGELEETLVIFTSDHGEMLGDHGQWQKDSPHHPSIGVPLVVAGPDVADDEACTAPVTTLDLHATILDYAGIDPGEVDSRSMRSLFAGRTDRARDVVYSGLSAWRAVYDGRFKLVRGYDPDRRTGTAYEPRGVEPNEVSRLLRSRPPILFDRERGEDTNVAAIYPDVVDRLTARLEEIRTAA